MNETLAARHAPGFPDRAFRGLGGKTLVEPVYREGWTGSPAFDR